jgi:uracil permease
MGGVCITLYGFIAVSGLKMIQKVDLNKNYNLFTVATILICGVGSMALKFGIIPLKAVAVSLILGILVNLVGKKAAKKDALEEVKEEKAE